MRNRRNTHTEVPTTGGTVTIPNGVDYLYINPAGTLATLTVNLPSSPEHGDILTILSSQALTALTMAVTTPQTLVGGATSATANIVIGDWVYHAPDMTWLPA